MKKNSVLITGAYGFVGRNISKFFNEKGWNVFGVGYGSWKDEEMKKWGIDHWSESKVDFESLKNLKITPNLIVHCAGSGSVTNSFSNPKEDFEANVSSVLPVLEFIRLKCPEARLIYPSSAAVYGDKGDISIKENDFLEPISPYGYHKKIAEELCEAYSKVFNVNISIIRFFSIYGPGLRKQLLWDACEKITNSRNRKVEFYGTGDETRDWIHVRDAANLVYKLSESKNKFEILNGASGRRLKTREMLEMFINDYGEKVKIVFNGKNKEGDPKHYLADISKAKRIGWSPKIKLEEGVEDYVAFCKANI